MHSRRCITLLKGRPFHFFFNKMTKEEVDLLNKKATAAETMAVELRAELMKLQSAVQALNDKAESQRNAAFRKLQSENDALRKEIARYKKQLSSAQSSPPPVVATEENKPIDKPNQGAAVLETKSGEKLIDRIVKDSLSERQQKAAEANAKAVEKIAKLTPSEIHSKLEENKSSDKVNQESLPKNEVTEKGKTESKKAAGDRPKGKIDEPPLDVGRLDLRVGKIVEIIKHPDADSLYVEQVDVGEEKPRTIVSGLVNYVPIEDMKERMVVILCNLKPVKMRGVLSEGMVMCASTPQKVEVLIPPQGAKPGDAVHVDGFPRVPDPILNPKKKVFETVAPDLKTDSQLVATYKGKPWSVPGKGEIKTASLKNVNIK